jgi:hypothetical protein
MQQYFGKLPDLVNSLTGNILSYALILTAVSTISMTFLELFKALFKMRPAYHRKKVKKWLKHTSSFDELLVLTVNTESAADSLFDQPTDKMMGQIQAAANVVVDFPNMYKTLYEFLSCVPEPYRTQIKLNEPSDADIWLNYMAKINLKGDLGPPLDAVQQATGARARIDHVVARKLDAFQAQTELYWARQNQYVSVIGSALFLIFLLSYISVPIGWSIILSFFGGMIAPFAKDVVSGLSGIRTK